MTRRQNFRGRVLQCTLLLVPLIIIATIVLQKHSSLLKNWRHALSADSVVTTVTSKTRSAGSCTESKECPVDHFSFFIQSGAANVVPPKICINNKLVLGSLLNNAGFGINIVVLNGKTGNVTGIDHFDMYSGEVNPLIQLLKSIGEKSVVLMASYDEPSSKLNDEAKQLIAELGSSAVQSLGFRDNWLFVGGKGASVKSSFEKHLKNNSAGNKYVHWPELIELQGCIPKYLE